MRRKHRRRALMLADAIEPLQYGDGPGQFRMETITNDCGSPSCIAGWTVHLFGDREDRMNPTLEAARALLGLGDLDGGELFFPGNDHAHSDAYPGEEGHISPSMAARCLRRLAETGRVEWLPEWAEE